MNTFIAYTLVVLGVPFMVGIFLGTLAFWPVAWAVPAGSAKKNFTVRLIRTLLLHCVHEVFCGFGAMLAAALIFHFLGLSFGWPILVVMMTWISVYFVTRQQPLRQLFSNLSGLLVAWLVVPHLFSSWL